VELLDRDGKDYLQFSMTRIKQRAAFWRMKGLLLALTQLDSKPVTISGTITGIPQEQVPEV